MRNFRALLEAPITQTMTDQELNLHGKIRQILINDGHGAHHAKYAELFKYFAINIIPLDDDPECTAYMDAEHFLIGIGEGFIFSPKYFWQLSVIVRHELAHFMLRHNLKYKILLSEEAMAHFDYSGSVHNLLNTIADFEISNKMYSVKDKDTIRNLKLNGEIIQGLITEDARADWERLSIEQMYKKLEAEIYEDQQKLSQMAEADLGIELQNNKDFITTGIRKAALKYKMFDTSKPRFKSVEKWLMGLEKTEPKIQDCPEFMQQLFKNIYTEFANESEQTLEDAIKTIKASAIIEPAIIKNIKIFTPEEKWLILGILASILHKDLVSDEETQQQKITIDIKRQKHTPEYVASYNDTIANLDNKNVSTIDLYQILHELQDIIAQNHEEDITGIVQNANDISDESEKDDFDKEGLKDEEGDE